LLDHKIMEDQFEMECVQWQHFTISWLCF
jgi:hypothetical protein